MTGAYVREARWILEGNRISSRKNIAARFVANKSEQTGRNDNNWKWHVKKIDRDKSGHRERPHQRVLQTLASNADECSGNDRQDCRFQSIKNRRNPENATVRDVDVT